MTRFRAKNPEGAVFADRDGNEITITTISLDSVGTNGGLTDPSRRSPAAERNAAAGKDEAEATGEGGSKEGTHREPRPDVLRVWGTYDEHVAHGRQEFNAKRRKIIEAALKVRPVETCCAAVVGLSVSPHHNGENPQQMKYLDIRYALRGNSQRGESNEERIDRMAALAPGGESEQLPRKVEIRLDNIRRHIASGGAFEPTRARDSEQELYTMGWQVEKLDGPPWAHVFRR